MNKKLENNVNKIWKWSNWKIENGTWFQFENFGKRKKIIIESKIESITEFKFETKFEKNQIRNEFNISNET